MSDENANPYNTLLNAAIALNEMFITLQQAGFTEAQALYIVAQTFRPKDST